MGVYTIRVYTGQEKKIANNILRLNNPNIKKVYAPITKFGQPVFPGYIFIDTTLTPDSYYTILDVPGVFFFLTPELGVYPLSEKEQKHIEDLSVKHPSLAGSLTQVISGPYEGIVGKLQGISYPYATIIPENFDLLKDKPKIKVHVKHLALIDEPLITSGTHVQIIDGELAGLTGVVEQCIGQQAQVSITVFDQETDLWLPVNYLQGFAQSETKANPIYF